MLKSKTISFTVPVEYNNKTLKEFLRNHCNITSRTLTKLKKVDLGITRNEKLIKTIDIVNYGDVIKIKLPADINEIVPIKGNLDIKYEDDYILVVNKPPFMPVHPTKKHQRDTLANIIVYYMLSKNENYTFRCLNRLDRNTSGLVVIAKDRYSANFLQNNLDKTYYAICEGNLNGRDTIKSNIKVEDGSSIKRFVSKDGDLAITNYETLFCKNNHTLLKINLETGRTHQIRCHMSSIGFPLAGDDLYGGHQNLINRQALHCKSISFIHPISKKSIIINSELPIDMNKIFEENR